MELIFNTRFLNMGSRIGTFMMVYGVLFLLYAYICEAILKLDRIVVFKRILLSDIISMILTTITIFKFITISSPY